MITTFECDVFLCALALAFFLFQIFNFFKERYEFLRLFRINGIPGPTPSFFLGNMEELNNSTLPHDVITSWLQEYGNVFGYYIAGMPHLVVKDLEMLKKVFVTDSEFFSNRPFAIDLSPYDKTLLGLKGKRWKEVRKILSRSFSTGNLKLLSTIVNKKVDITVDIISKKARAKEIFNIYELIQGLSVDVIADCALAMETSCQENPKDIFFNEVRDTFKHVKNGAVKLAMAFPSIGRLMAHLYKFSTAGKMTNHIMEKLKAAIKERRENPEIRRVDFLQLMLDNREDEENQVSGLTDEEILANSFIFLVAGFETTANALSFTIDLLIKHPDVQERLYHEIAAAAVDGDTYENVQSIPYLDQVIKESLRIYPPATLFTTRQCTTEYRLGSITLPVGSAVVAPVWDIHHDPDLWPDPWKFDPDRFSPENRGSIDNQKYIPFGVGRRNCIGSQFALSELKLILFKLLTNFKFEVCEKTENPLTLNCPTTVIGPANGIYLRTLPRLLVV